MPVPLIIVMVLITLLAIPVEIIETIFYASLWEAIFWSFGILVVVSVAGIVFFLWGEKQSSETQDKVFGLLIGVVVSLLSVILIGFSLIKGVVFEFTQDYRLGIIITTIISIFMFFLILNVAKNFYSEEQGFIKGTKAWFMTLPMFPVLLGLSLIGLIIPDSGSVCAILFLVWLVYFFGYPLLRGLRTMDNIKRKQELKNFAGKYREAIKEGTDLPVVPTRNIPQITGMVSGWFSKLRAKDATEIAKAHAEISGYAVRTAENETNLIIELETRDNKIALAKDEIVRTYSKRDREDEIEQLELERKRMEHLIRQADFDNQNQGANSKLEEYRQKKELKKGMHDIDQEFEINSHVEDSFKEIKIREAIKKEGNIKIAEANLRHAKGEITDAELQKEIEDIKDMVQSALDQI